MWRKANDFVEIMEHNGMWGCVRRDGRISIASYGFGKPNPIVGSGAFDSDTFKTKARAKDWVAMKLNCKVL